ncbi:MAG TPA: hypothetical protein DHM42_06090 [Clostridiales bacterium]|jgi:uncharacterized membrane protein|nr:hypothetical protein [Clostridiales bacterium]
MIILDKIKKIISSIWFYPAVYGFLSLLGAFFIILIDTRYLSQFHTSIPEILLTTPELARDIHGIIASAFITITTFTFSITMVVLTMYMSQLSPRVVENFLKNKSTMQSFGIFVGGFTYSIVSLLFTRNTSEGYLVISASIGVVYIIVGLIYFLLFINSVATFIQTSNVIDRLHKESILKIKKYKATLKNNPIIKEIDKEKYGNSKVIRSSESGYIQKLDYDELSQIANKKKLIIHFEKVIGQFINKDEKIFTVYAQEDLEDKEEILNKIKKLILIGKRKTEEQDFSYTIQKIVEVSLRAISPGINDPNTAIHCVRIIGVLLGMLSNIDDGYIVVNEDKESEGLVLLEAYSFKMILHDAFTQIVHYGHGDITVVIAVMRALKYVSFKSKKANKKIVKDYIEFVYRKTKSKHLDDFEIEILDMEMDSYYKYS